MSESDGPLVEVEDLRTYFDTDEGTVRAVDGVSFAIRRAGTLALVGESGCGKSVTALSMLRLVPRPPGRIAGGRVRFKGRDILALPERAMRRIRGREISMIFQEPMTSLNPVFTVGAQVMEAVRLHQRASRREARDRTVAMLDRVGIPNARARFREYPHQMSGGMKQRVMIAMALVCRPSLLIADEPTTALDVTIQAQILDLLRELQREFQMSILLITHDLGIVAEMADHVAVMYAGKIAEYAGVRALFAKPRHPYTAGLFRSLPAASADKTRLDTIPGQVPNPLDLPGGCPFWPRCPIKTDICAQEHPPFEEKAPGHFAACWKAEKAAAPESSPSPAESGPR